MKYNKLTFVAEAGKNSDGRVLWLVRCDCGVEVVRVGRNVVSGATKSCGCMRGWQRITHGHSRGRKLSREYKSWIAMRGRCDYETNKAYKHYGGRGIRYPESWKSFEQFYADMGDCPKGMTLERRDVNADYSKSNCYWDTLTAQARNKRTTIWLEFRGERLPLATWAERIGVRPMTLYQRLNRGWSVERALTEGVRKWPSQRAA